MWISFDQFDLEDGDVLTLYNYKAANTMNPSIIRYLTYVVATYTKNNPPELDKIIELEKNGLYLKFQTDNNKSGKGWSFKYGINVGVGEAQAGLTAIDVYPNPATERVNVRLAQASDENRSVYIRLSDMSGRILHNEKLTMQADATCSISTQDLAAGIYLLNIQTDKGSVCRKVQVVR